MFCKLKRVVSSSLKMGTLRGLLALLCVLLAGAQTQDLRRRFAGKFAENTSYILRKSCSVCCLRN